MKFGCAFFMICCLMASCTGKYNSDAGGPAVDTTLCCDRTDVAMKELKGRVKSVNYIEYDISYGFREGRPIDTAFHNFIQRRSESFLFDTAGYMLQEKNTEGSQGNQNNYLLDATHHMIERDLHTADGKTRKMTFTYNGMGQLDEERDYDDTLSYIIVYAYDTNKHQLIRFDTYKAPGRTPINYTIYKYKGKDMIEELDYFATSAAPQQRISYTYDDTHRIIAQTTYRDSSTLRTAEKFTWYPSGRMASHFTHEVYVNSTADDEYKMTYDSHGSLAEKIYTNWYGGTNDKKSRYYLYHYDDTGNWTEQRECTKQSGRLIPVKLTKAEIEYY